MTIVRAKRLSKQGLAKTGFCAKKAAMAVLPFRPTPFFANKNAMGYDHYSLYAIARKLGRIKTLAIGDYRIRFGEGLILNNDFMFGKLASLTSFNDAVVEVDRRSLAWISLPTSLVTRSTCFCWAR